MPSALHSPVPNNKTTAQSSSRCHPNSIRNALPYLTGLLAFLHILASTWEMSHTVLTEPVLPRNCLYPAPGPQNGTWCVWWASPMPHKVSNSPLCSLLSIRVLSFCPGCCLLGCTNWKTHKIPKKDDFLSVLTMPKPECIWSRTMKLGDALFFSLLP